MSLNQTTVHELVRRVRRSDEDTVSIFRNTRGWAIIVIPRQVATTRHIPTRTWRGATLGQAISAAMTLPAEEET